MEDNRIDRLFKKALQQEQIAPPEDMWYRILQCLDKRKKRKKLILWWSSGIAATFTLLFSVTLIGKIQKDTAAFQEGLPIVWVSPNQNNLNNSPDSILVASILSEKKIIPEISPISSKDKIQKSRVYSIAPIYLPKRCNHTPLHGHITINTTIRKEIIPLINKRAYETYDLYYDLLYKNSNYQKEKLAIPSQRIKLSLSGHFIPGYASGSYTNLINNARTKSVSNKEMSGIFSIGGGLKLTFLAGKKWAFQTGILYTQLGQQTKQKGSRILYAGLATSGTDMPVFSPLGTIRRKHSPRVTENTGLFSLPSPQPTSIEQVFGAMEIPVSVKYKWNMNKFVISLLGGISGSFIVSNKAYSNENGKREYIGNTEDIRNFNITTNMGLGLEYPISRKIKIMIEPGFRYYLQSISRDEAIDFKPYMVSVSTGIGIDF